MFASGGAGAGGPAVTKSQQGLLCGYQFCYICGAEWKNKKATCACPLWDERRIFAILDSDPKDSQAQMLLLGDRRGLQIKIGRTNGFWDW
ncbi:hypothetical protein U1Q18_033144 [Sarracenia purpurea var. burkii]